MKQIKRLASALLVFVILLSASVFRVTAIALRCDEDFTFLVLGVDGTWLNTDTIMLARVDASGEKINVLSIPRDTMVSYEGRRCKINSVFAKSVSRGTSLKDSAATFKSFLADVFGVSIDFTLVLNSDAFISIVDSVNGVDITLDEDVNIEMQGGELLSLKKGDNRLFGREALYFVRHRKSYADADLGRIGAQSVFVRAFLKKLSGLDTIAALNLYKITLDKVVIDASLNMLSSIDGIIKSLRYKDFSFYVLPGEPIILNKVSYYKINRAEGDKMLSIFGGRFSSNDGDFIY